MRKIVTLIVVLAVAIGGAVAASLTFWAPSQAAVEPATVTVERGNVEQTVLATSALLASSA